MNIALTNRGLLRAVLVAFALLLSYRFLAVVTTTFLLLAAALLLAVILSAPVEALHRRGLSRSAATGLLVLVVLVVLGLGAYFLLPTLARQASQVVSGLPGALTQLLEQARALAQSYGFQIGGGGGGSFISQAVSSIGRRLLGGIVGVFSSLTSVLFGLLVLVLVPLYLVSQPEPAVGWFSRFFPPDRRDEVRGVLSDVRSGLLRWLVGRLVSMAIIGTLATIALYLLGVPGALFLGILTGLLEFVPLVGPTIAAIPPFLIAFTVSPTTALWVLLTYVGIQQVESYVVEPLVMKKAVSLHPAAVVVAVTVGGALFGILGTILAVPATVAATILIEELWFERLEDGDGGPNEGKGGQRPEPAG